jgi:hypothetical protein
MDASTQIKFGINFLPLIRQWLQSIEISNPHTARFLCKLIPAYCPFERDIKLLGYKLLHIPPLCKINPLYEQIVELRFKSLTYLADQLGEDISAYC